MLVPLLARPTVIQLALKGGSFLYPLVNSISSDFRSLEVEQGGTSYNPCLITSPTAHVQGGGCPDHAAGIQYHSAQVSCLPQHKHGNGHQQHINIGGLHHRQQHVHLPWHEQCSSFALTTTAHKDTDALREWLFWHSSRRAQFTQQRHLHHSIFQHQQVQQRQLHLKQQVQQAGGATNVQSAPRPSNTSLIMHVLPPWAHPYAQLMRLDKPIGTWLLLWPSLWSIAMAAEPGHWPDIWTAFLFSIGAVLLRGSGCTINDLWDRDLDRRVERTRSRPLASGAVSPMQAIGLLAAQLSLGLVILLQLNDYSKVLGASSLTFVGLYPLMKRITHWPQAFLGLTINWGALLGWAAVQGSCNWSVVLPLYLSGACWSLIYDTIYAHQDKIDDAAAGMGSTALLFGQKTDLVLLGFTTAQMALLTLAGGNAGMAWPYYAGVTGMACHIVWQIRTVDLNDTKDCMDMFLSNKWAGGILFAGCVGGRLLSA